MNMKKLMTIVASVALLLGVSTAAQAQERDHTSAYNFITLQGGAQTTFTNYDCTKLITPQYAITFGRYFNDKAGARLHVMGYKNKGAFPAGEYNIAADTKYNFNACTADLDLLMNMTNIINPRRQSHAFDWVLIAGFGVNYAWDFDQYKAITNAMKFYYEQPECGTKHSSFNGRLGTQLNWNVSNAFTIGLELQANYKNDIYNLKHNDKCDWQAAAFLGVTYNFGYKRKAAPKPEPEPEPAPVPVVVEPEPEPAPVVVEQPKPVVKDEPLKETIFYKIRVSDVNKPEYVIDRVYVWHNKYPNKMIHVSGYADKGTGNPAINKRYALQRAQKVADALREKGIPADRLTVDSFGDTVQPYADNDLNRCVIIVGE